MRVESLGDGGLKVECEGVEVEISRSRAGDGAMVVSVNTDFEPDGSDAGPGLRVWVNDDDVYEGVPWTQTAEWVIVDPHDAVIGRYGTRYQALACMTEDMMERGFAILKDPIHALGEPQE